MKDATKKKLTLAHPVTPTIPSENIAQAVNSDIIQHNSTVIKNLAVAVSKLWEEMTNQYLSPKDYQKRLAEVLSTCCAEDRCFIWLEVLRSSKSPQLTKQAARTLSITFTHVRDQEKIISEVSNLFLLLSKSGKRQLADVISLEMVENPPQSEHVESLYVAIGRNSQNLNHRLAAIRLLLRSSSPVVFQAGDAFVREITFGRDADINFARSVLRNIIERIPAVGERRKWMTSLMLDIAKQYKDQQLGHDAVAVLRNTGLASSPKVKASLWLAGY